MHPEDKENNKQMKAALLLLPNLLGQVPHHSMVLPASVERAVATIDGLICESETAGRRYLGYFTTKKPAREIPLAVYDARTPDGDIDFFLEPIRNGERWGLVSDAGLPCIVDPGYKLVARARSSGIAVQGFTGPSAIMHALMLSGLPGQQFAFHGYLAKDPAGRTKALLQLEKNSLSGSATQIFIETPYRNQHLLETALEILQPETLLCVAWDLTLPSQGILSQTIAQWKKMPVPNLDKKPAVFLVFRSSLSGVKY
jgi:16S rRNA (cytidine1402-2'-O)-methyltransferase